MTSDIERNIHQRYAQQEILIQTRLEQLRQKTQTDEEGEIKEVESRRERLHKRALKRNKEFLQDIEKTVGRLTTSCLYFPSEQILEQEKKRYYSSITALRKSQTAGSA